MNLSYCGPFVCEGKFVWMVEVLDLRWLVRILVPRSLVEVLDLRWLDQVLHLRWVVEIHDPRLLVEVLILDGKF